jgi:hypothetical protein
MHSKPRSTLMTMMLGAALWTGAAQAQPAQPPAAALLPEGSGWVARPQHWAEELSTGEGTGELVRTREGLLFEPYAVMRRPEGQQQLMGLYTFPSRTLEQPVDTVQPLIQARASFGMNVEVDVRVLAPSGAWSEWSTSSAGEAVRLPWPGTEVQVRLALLADSHGRGPLVHEVKLRGSLEGGTASSPGEMQAAAALTYRVFATREGLVGGTTANGHVITTNDRFVALPSRRALASNGGSEYQVRVCYSVTGKCTTTSVWDVGPWNTKDDYWNPSSVREMWKDLPQGKPEAQAAYQDGYNGGLDQFGRRPANPAGIDIADGSFWTDLGMSNNGWVDVTYLWTSTTTTGLVIDSNNANNDTSKGYIEVTGTSWTSSTNVAGYYGTGYFASPTAAVSEPATFWFYVPTAGSKTISAWWTSASDRSTTAPFIIWNSAGTKLATVNVNQQLNGGRWNTLGTWSFPVGWNKVQVSRWTTAGSYVIADAIRVQ